MHINNALLTFAYKLLIMTSW